MRIKPLPNSFDFRKMVDPQIGVSGWEQIHGVFLDGQEPMVKAIAGTFAKEINENMADLWSCKGYQKGTRKYRIVHKWARGPVLIIDVDINYNDGDYRFLVFNEEGEGMMYLRYTEAKGVDQVQHFVNTTLRMADQKLIDHNAQVMVMFLVGIDVFINNAKVKTRILPPRKKLKEFNCKYFNEGKQHNVEVYDTRFFTTTSGAPFAVKGFMRMQACGPGWSERRPTWVAGFVKSGVTRRAKIDHK